MSLCWRCRRLVMRRREVVVGFRVVLVCDGSGFVVVLVCGDAGFVVMRVLL